MDIRQGSQDCGRDRKVKSGLRLLTEAQPDLTAAGQFGGTTMRFMPRVVVFVLGITLLLGFGILVYGDNSPTQPPAEFAPPGYLRASSRSELIVLFREPPRDGVSKWDATGTAGGNFLEVPFESIAEPADTRNVTFR